jgi:hypothetical protein
MSLTLPTTCLFPMTLTLCAGKGGPADAAKGKDTKEADSKGKDSKGPASQKEKESLKEDGTLKPAAGFNADKDCETLHNAMKGFGESNTTFRPT